MAEQSAMSANLLGKPVAAKAAHDGLGTIGKLSTHALAGGFGPLFDLEGLELGHDP